MRLVIPEGETGLGKDVPVDLWQPPGSQPEQPMGLLVVNDGVDYEQYAGFTWWLESQVADGRIPPHRVALMHRHTDDRFEWYSSNPAYSWAVHHLIKDILPNYVSIESPVVGIGASLGGHAMLAMGLHHPGTIDRMLLQSPTMRSSMELHPDDDLNVLHHTQLSRVVQTAKSIAERFHQYPSIRISMSCSNAEGNFWPNLTVLDALKSRGHDLDFTEIQGYQHNFTSWGDLLKDKLPGLLVSEHAAAPIST